MTADPWGALLDEAFGPVAGAEDGPLAGTTFVAKDLFAVAGHVVGAGQPTWAATHPRAAANAPAVQRLLDAGSSLLGRAHTSQMAYSLSGRDTPSGGPDNPAAPGHDTGGSSSGSAAAVAGGVVDLGLGTDTLGSVRVPASHTGVYGWRPTHGLVTVEAVHPLARSLDTVGLLARDPGLLLRGAEVLAARPLDERSTGRLLVFAAAFAELDPALRGALHDEVEHWAPGATVDLLPDGLTLTDLTVVVRDVQGPEFAADHRAWIEAERPTFLPAVAERIEHALGVTAEQHAAATEVRDRLRNHLASVLEPGDAVLVPLAGRPARRDADDRAYAEARRLAASFSVVGSLGGLPTVAVPAVVVDGTPAGLGLLGPPGSDGRLLRLAAGRPPVPPATHRGSA